MVPEPAPEASPSPFPPGPAPRRPPPGGAFRARLERDPRRFVLLIAALEGAATFALNAQGARDVWLQGPGPLVALAILAATPALGALGMLVHGRLLLWTGKPLRGRAAAHEIHAAFAWSQLPLVVAGTPLVIEIPLRVAARGLDPPPRWLSRAVEGLESAADAFLVVAAIAAVAGAIRYVRYLAIAQRFSAWRALANHLLAGVLGAAIGLGAVLLARVMQPGAALFQLLPLATALSVALPLGVERVVIRLRARARRGGS